MAKKKTKLSKKHHFENNKLLLILLLVLGFILVIVYATVDQKGETTSMNEIHSAVNSSMVTIPETSFAVNLVDGKGEFSDSVTEGSVSISEPFFSVKSGKSYDSFAVMTYSTGGSGEFVAVALFQTKDGKALYRGSYPIGDRVVINSISKVSGDETNYEVSVGYLDREEGAPLATAPTLAKTLSFSVDNHRITVPADLE